MAFFPPFFKKTGSVGEERKRLLMFSQERLDYFKSLSKSIGEAGTASLALVVNGIQVPYATTTATIGTASTEAHTISLTGVVRVLPNAPVTIAVINNGVALTPTVTNFKAVKIV